jgi:hypothetical protein
LRFTLQEIIMPQLSRALLLLAATALVAHSQTVTGTILGVVTDPSGAVVPGAIVAAANRATGFSRSAKSDREGNYLITFLPLGAYNVQANSSGFERTVRENITVQADERTRVDLALKVGAATQTVQVSEGTPLVQTSDATVGEVVDSKHISDLPLNKRNFVDLVQLTAGVTPGRPADFGGDGTIRRRGSLHEHAYRRAPHPCGESLVHLLPHNG